MDITRLMINGDGDDGVYHVEGGFSVTKDQLLKLISLIIDGGPTCAVETLADRFEAKSKAVPVVEKMVEKPKMEKPKPKTDGRWQERKDVRSFITSSLAAGPMQQAVLVQKIKDKFPEVDGSGFVRRMKRTQIIRDVGPAPGNGIIVALTSSASTTHPVVSEQRAEAPYSKTAGEALVEQEESDAEYTPSDEDIIGMIRDELERQKSPLQTSQVLERFKMANYDRDVLVDRKDWQAAVSDCVASFEDELAL